MGVDVNFLCLRPLSCLRGLSCWASWGRGREGGARVGLREGEPGRRPRCALARPGGSALKVRVCKAAAVSMVCVFGAA